MKENPFVIQRKHNLGLLLALIRNNPDWPRKKVLAVFASSSGTTTKKASEYYQQLIDSEQILPGD